MKFNERFKSGDVVKVPVASQVFTGGLNRIDFSKPWMKNIFGENPTHANVVVAFFSNTSYVVQLITPNGEALESLSLREEWAKGCRKVGSVMQIVD